MIAALIMIALIVAALGIPGVLPWLHRRAFRWERRRRLHREHVMVTLDQARDTIQDARRLVPPSSPSGVVRPPGPSPIPSLSALRAATQDEIDARLQLSDGMSAKTRARINAARSGREDPPAPPPRPRPR